jgi:membrane protease YdiL (CAAX protease family)
VIATLLTVYLLVQTGAWIVGIVLMRLVLPKGTPIKERSLSFGRFLVIALMCFGVWGVGAVLGNLSSFFGAETQELFSVDLLGAEILPYLIYAVIGAPVVEELAFRKVLCDRLHDTHEGYAAVISGLLFGLMHGNHQQFFLAFFIGMLFAMVYQRTGRIVYTMLLHGMINLTATLPEFLSLAGVDISLGWNIAVGALIVAGLIVLLIRRKDPILHAAPCTVCDANNAVYRNPGMRIVRIAALVLIGVQGTAMTLLAMLQASDRMLLHLIDAIPLTLVFLTVFLLPIFTKRYEKGAEHLNPAECAQEAGV